MYVVIRMPNSAKSRISSEDSRSSDALIYSYREDTNQTRPSTRNFRFVIASST